MKRAIALLLISLISISPLSASVTPSTGDAFLQKTAQMVTMGNVTSITPPGRPAHVYTYDAGNQVKGYTPPDLGVGPTATNYAYDLENHPTLITRPDGQTLTFDYNAGGQLSTVTTPSGTYNYTYDSAGRLSNLSESTTGINLSYAYDGTLPLSTTWTGPVTGDVSRTYDNNFRVVSQSVNGGNTINYAYDNDGLLTNAGDLTLTRDADNGLLTATDLNVVTDAWTYNQFGEPTNYTAKTSGADAYSVTYTRDALGRITEKNETIGATSHLYKYTYDLSGRLTTVQKDGSTAATYTYDDNGNRIKKVANAVTTNGTYDAQDRLLTYGGNIYTYTDNGELKTKTDTTGTTTYTYDVAGNLRTAALPNGTIIDYVIDGQNRRIGKKVNGTLTQGFLYNNQLQIVAELDGAGAIVTRFIYADRSNVPSFMVKGGTTYRIISDHLGSPRLVVNAADGSVAQKLDYDEFGNVLTDTNPGFSPFAFAGGLHDQDTKLVRFGARDYDPENGRWTTKDPIDFQGRDENLYGYVWNSPINFIDPIGLWGSGVMGGVEAETGYGVVGAGAQGQVGAGFFSSGFFNNNSIGVFAAGGVFAGTPFGGIGMPSGQGGVAGISGGGGLAGFFTNANCVDQLAGPFWTATFNIGIGPAKFSISYATDGTIWIASFGPPFAGGTLGASGSLFQTTTVVLGQAAF